MANKSNYLIKVSEASKQKGSISHPWNPNSLITGTQLGKLAGLKRIGVNIAPITPGKESFMYHSHQLEEEWIYIISGKGIAEIDGKEYEVAEGDFMGFPTPGVAHHLKNPFDSDLTYLFGGENATVEIADFPNLRKRMIRYPDSKVEIFNYEDEKGFGSFESK